MGWWALWPWAAVDVTKLVRFVETEQALRELDAKAMACPHCHALGTLNAHGWLRGYSEMGGPVLRGKRLYCSQRHRRPGCGRTWAVRISAVMAHFIASTPTLERFVHEVLDGVCRSSAWQQACAGALSLTTGYRLWQRLSQAQSALRARLLQHCPPPDSASPAPMAQLVSHLHRALGTADGVLARFQSHFQVGIFG